MTSLPPSGYPELPLDSTRVSLSTFILNLVSFPESNTERNDGFEMCSFVAGRGTNRTMNDGIR